MHVDLFGYWAAQDSALDHFTRFSGSADRLIVRRVLTEGPTLYKMDDAVATPVERLR